MKSGRKQFWTLVATGAVVFGLGMLTLTWRSGRALRFSNARGTGESRSAAVVAGRDTRRSTPPAPKAVGPDGALPVVPADRALVPAGVPRSAVSEAKIPGPKFARFAAWLDRFDRADAAGRLSLEAEGVVLARQRRDEMVDLIQSQPARALELTVPSSVRRRLPPSILAQLETLVAGRGSLEVLAALAEPGREGEIPPVTRTATIAGESYRAFMYGRRLGEPTRWDVPLHGVAVDGLLAVNENPVVMLDRAEMAFRKQQLAASADPVCSISGNVTTSAGDETAVDIGGETVFLCHANHAQVLNEQWIAAESGGGGGAAPGAAVASSYTEGIKTLLVIRVDFSDLKGDPFGETAGKNLISGLNDFYREMSYGKTGFELAGAGSDVTPTLRMPQTAAYYGARDASVLRKDARAAAAAAGYTLADYQFDLICMDAVPGFKWSGLGYVGAPGAWVRNSSAVGVAAHELGHNFGLNHANFWDTAGQSAIGSGSSVEYGDKFDTMGSANAGSKHFNARYKSFLNWLAADEVLNVTQSGTYRLGPHDDPAASGVRALRITKGGGTNYWLEYRARYTGNKWLASGVGLRWAGAGNQSTRLLDLTPGSANGKDDSCLLIGRTFSDFSAGIHVTPIGRAGTTPESLEIVIQRGTFGGNLPPVVTLAAPVTSAAANVELRFTASASDPNGDPLAYFWDFGDGNFSGNEPGAGHRWSGPGEYLVQCTVTDLKGGTASASQVIRIGSPNTFRISGKIFADGQPVPGVRVAASSTQMTFSNSDGTYTLVGLSSGSYTLKATLENYVFSHAGFANPVKVGPSRTNIDFAAIPPDGQNAVSLVAAGSIWQYLDDGSDAGTAWREPEFNDATWSEGPAPLGYGDDNEKTVVRYGPNASSKYITTYFRHPFVVDDPAALSGLTLSLRRDDGAVVYLNGRELLRSNMPTGTIAADTLAAETVSGTDETAFFDTVVDPALLRAGTNVFAVEIHQSSRSSSDIVLDLQLLGTAAPAAPAPALAWEISGGTLKILWPDTAAQWTLEASSGLGTSALWTNVTVSGAASGGQRAAILPVGDRQQFYRLVRSR